MAKKVVATLKSKDRKGLTKIIKMVKTEKGGYTFRETMVDQDIAKKALAEMEG